ncbi:MAG: HAD family phosphatase [Rhodobacteraceae bacterium]|nr:HAD family phosphatase [Paracoccaceae bacterium]
MTALPDRLPKAILFDCDGTLLLTADLHYSAISGAAARQGVVMPRDWYMALTGLDRTDLYRRFAADFGVAPDMDRLVTESIALTVEAAGQARLNPPVAALAGRMAGRLPIAVVTNSERAIVTAVLTATGLISLFDAVVPREDARAPKPAPDLFLVAARRLGIAAEDCLVLEDSAQGLEAARRAGMRCVDVRDADSLDRVARLDLAA